MSEVGPTKKLTSPSHIRNWLKLLAGHCASNTKIADLMPVIDMMGVELSVLYPQSCFTTTTASEVAMAFQFGFPTLVQMRKELERYVRETPKTQGGGGKAGKLEFSEERLADGRVSIMDFADRVLLAQYDRRAREIRAEGDPFWDSLDPDLKKQSKIVNLASMYRTHVPRVWDILQFPAGDRQPAPEVAFLLERAGQMKAQLEERARQHAERKERLNQPPLEAYEDQGTSAAPGYEDEVNF